MTTEQIRDAIARAAAVRRLVTVELRDGTLVTDIPTGAGRPRFFRFGDAVIHQYDIVDIR